MKRCFVVCGPESSGNRLLAALLIRAGCLGEASTAQRWDRTLPEHESPAVVLRSYPHGNVWPDLRDVYRTLRDRGYAVRVLITVRDAWCVVQSQIERHHHPAELARENVRRAYRRIFAQLEEINAWWMVVPYESLVLHPMAATQRLLETLGLPVDNLGGPVVVEGVARPGIQNGNAPHYR